MKKPVGAGFRWARSGLKGNSPKKVEERFILGKKQEKREG